MNIIELSLKKSCAGISRAFSVITALAILIIPVNAHATIDGVTGPSFNLTAGEGYASFADGGSLYSWGYSITGEAMQLPGPTLIVTEGQTVTVTLTNALPIAAGNVSIIFPGHVVTGTSGGAPGALTQEAPSGGTVTYTFTAGQPGTYQYHSGTRTDLQVDMGLYGALIVRPAVQADATYLGCAYNHVDSCFDREYLFLLSEMDKDLHESVATQVAAGASTIDTGTGAVQTQYFMINGRSGPDTMAGPGRSLLPFQPYNILPQMHPGEKLLLRIVGAGRRMHPFHTHGNSARLLARDGRMLLNANGKLDGPLLFTFPAVPGGTQDAIFEWTGKDLGWDMYGHTDRNDGLCQDTNGDGYDDVGAAGNLGEWCADHGKPIPVQLPDLSVMAFGGFYSGSPYLGAMGSLPPGEGGLNPNAGFAYMWHSHAERELTNNNVYPGGMLTILIIEAPGVPIQ